MEIYPWLMEVLKKKRLPWRRNNLMPRRPTLQPRMFVQTNPWPHSWTHLLSKQKQTLPRIYQLRVLSPRLLRD